MVEPLPHTISLKSILHSRSQLDNMRVELFAKLIRNKERRERKKKTWVLLHIHEYEHVAFRQVMFDHDVG